MAHPTWEEFQARYQTRLEENTVIEHFIPYAASRLEAVLAPGFAVPFGEDNLTAKDLMMDLTYLLILQRSKAPQEYRDLWLQTEKRIEALLKGKDAMIIEGQPPLFAAPSTGEVWSSGGHHLMAEEGLE